MRFLRKVIRIRASDSPNVRARAQVIPGVLSWEEYQKRLLTWDVMRQCIGLDGEFWEGREVLMFPSDWLSNAERVAEGRGSAKRTTVVDGERYIGCDPAEGGDRSSWCIGDRVGLLGMLSIKTPDTTVVTSTTLHLMREWDVLAKNVCFDRGGGGKEHADRLRLAGHQVRTVAFGESVVPQLNRRGKVKVLQQRIEEREDRTAYKNRRAEMYGTLMAMLDPADQPWGLPKDIINRGEPGRKTLREQLSLIPKLYDAEGRLYLLPKSAPKGQNAVDNDGDPIGTDTLIGLIGHSPDEADALAVLIHCMTVKAAVGMVVGVG